MIDFSIFREYDIRGIYGQNLTQDIVFGIGVALGEIIKASSPIDNNQNDSMHIVIGYDARTHSPTLYQWLKEGLGKSGVKVYHIGMVPTPVAYFATHVPIDGICAYHSVMITGSHNPPQYNGFKITLNRKPFYGASIQALGAKLAQTPISFTPSHTQDTSINALKVYHEYLTTHFAKLKNFPYPIALDYGNGVGALGLEAILDKLAIPHHSLFHEPNGHFPNHHPDPSEEANLTDLKNYMEQHNIPIGLAFDGDADRIALLTSKHSYKGDELAILFAKNLAQNGTPPLVIGEVKCSQAMYEYINKIGKSIMYKTGHSNLKVKLKETGAHLAAEMSGHMFFNDRYFGYDDAIYAGLRALELFLEETPQAIEAAIANLPVFYSTPEEKIPTSEEDKFTIIQRLHTLLQTPPADFPAISEIISIDGVRVVFKDGWGLVRASNTTPVLVTRFEAKDPKNAQLYKTKLLELIEHIKSEL
ncbi:phosphomannomutase/phosphoglucomutase [Helicobacter sp. 12S02634-8]|uniref:phosphomannomutase/phosphoglucomutase n=1 Tax=Helicobacter sp. 12S02634-8 TaxID=1476199 RepID=UPI00155670DF|nr:phosphomannomutase/phosphoglucomutase [Helicobacter sp. 12S02634-8]